jgi:hypothetical protein
MGTGKLSVNKRSKQGHETAEPGTGGRVNWRATIIIPNSSILMLLATVTSIVTPTPSLRITCHSLTAGRKSRRTVKQTLI